MITPPIAVKFGEHRLEFSIDEVLKYNGFQVPEGVAHGFKVMQRIWPLLNGGQPPIRDKISVDTAFPGPGVRDTFELITRAVTRGQYKVDPSLARAGVPESPKGHYLFIVNYEGKRYEAVLKDGFVNPAFIALARKSERTAEEEAQLSQMKLDILNRIAPLDAATVYDLRILDSSV